MVAEVVEPAVKLLADSETLTLIPETGFPPASVTSTAGAGEMAAPAVVAEGWVDTVISEADPA